MIKVCHMTTVHDRYDSRILKKECVSLANAGYDVTLLVADNLPDENYKNVKISSIDFSPKNRLDRILNSKKQMLKKAFLIDADVYHFHDPELIPVGLSLKKKNKKVIYDSHEDYPNDIKEKKLWIPKFIRPIIALLYKKYEMKSVGTFTAIVSVTPNIVSRFKLVNNNSFMITNYPIFIKNIDKVYDYKKASICFCGAVSLPWAHDSFINAIENIEGVQYVLAGPLNDYYINNILDGNTKDNINYLGVISQDEVYKIYSSSLAGMAIIHYGPTDNDRKGSLGVTKLFEYMMFKLPVICTNFEIWEDIVNDSKCGITVSPNNINEITEAVRYLVSNREVAQEMGENGRKAVYEKYNWKTQEKILLDMYRKILSS